MTTTSADIQKYEVSAEGNVYYFIKVVYNGREWAVRKRYSDFSRLDEFLQKDGFKLSYALPSKQFWNKFDKKALKERQKGLQSYLNTLLTNTVSSDNSLVKEFLEVDHNRLQHARKQSFHALKRSERLESLVTIMNRMVIHIPVKNNNANIVIQQQKQHQQHINPITRESSGSFPTAPYLQKSKSLSFSMKFSFSSNSRKNSFQPDSRQSFASMERKHSLEYIPSSNKTSSVDVATLKDLLKKEAYEYGVNALWSVYASELSGVVDNIDAIKQISPSHTNYHVGMLRSYYRNTTTSSSSSNSNHNSNHSSTTTSNNSNNHHNSSSTNNLHTTTTTIPTTNSPTATSRRHSITELIPNMSSPTPTIGNDSSIELYLDSYFHQNTPKITLESSRIRTNSEIYEDKYLANDAQEFVNYQQKYHILTYLTELLTSQEQEENIMIEKTIS